MASSVTSNYSIVDTKFHDVLKDGLSKFRNDAELIKALNTLKKLFERIGENRRHTPQLDKLTDACLSILSKLPENAADPITFLPPLAELSRHLQELNRDKLRSMPMASISVQSVKKQQKVVLVPVNKEEEKANEATTEPINDQRLEKKVAETNEQPAKPKEKLSSESELMTEEEEEEKEVEEETEQEWLQKLSKQEQLAYKNLLHLEDYILKAINEIKKLERKEISLKKLARDNTAFIKEGKLKVMLNKALLKYRQIARKFPHLAHDDIPLSKDIDGPFRTKLKLDGMTRYKEVDEQLAKHINKHRETPDYQEVRDLILNINKTHSLNITNVDDLAKECFKHIINKIKKRRMRYEDDVLKDNLLSVYANESDDTQDGEKKLISELQRDPASEDSSLKKKIEENFALSEQKFKQLQEKYAKLQDESDPKANYEVDCTKDGPQEGDDEDLEQVEENEEDEEDDNDDNDDSPDDDVSTQVSDEVVNELIKDVDDDTNIVNSETNSCDGVPPTTKGTEAVGVPETIKELDEKLLSPKTKRTSDAEDNDGGEDSADDIRNRTKKMKLTDPQGKKNNNSMEYDVIVLD